MYISRAMIFAASGLMLAVSSPALADVKAGVDAWTRGDYPAAVREWRDPAAKGDPDAQFNMAQAYRLGRGVEVNPRQAEVLYAKAAAQGHIKAADNYGLLLFQDGRREEAMPYLTAASERGDPRAQYLIGLAHFNGDLLAKDWVRAYALLTLSNSSGLPQAAPALAQMDEFIPREQREQAQDLAKVLKRESDGRRSAQLAAADLAVGETAAPPPRQVTVAQPSVLPPRTDSIPRAIPSAAVPPSVAAARAAVSEAARVTGTESPAAAGADYARPAEARAAQAQAAPAPQTTPAVRRPAPTPAATPAPVRTASAAPRPAATSGPWKVQLGAFGVRSNAEGLWSRLASRSELAGKTKLLVPAGNLTKLQAGGFATRADAAAACSGLSRAGQACLVTK